MIPTPAILKLKLLWTRKQILSLAILRRINVFKFPDLKSPDSALDACKKDTVGTAQGGLIHVVFCKKGPKVTRMIFTCIQQIVNYWLFHNGFSIGIGDTVADKKTMKYITEQIKIRKTNVADDAYNDRLKEKAYDGLCCRLYYGIFWG